MAYTYAYTCRLLHHLLLRPLPREARALAPTSAALRRRKRMLPHYPWPGPAWTPEVEASSRQQCGDGDTGTGAAAVVQAPRRLVGPPCWVLELHLSALPRTTAAWGDLAALPQLASLLLPQQLPRLPAAALPHIAALTGLRALQLSVAGAAAEGGVGLLAVPGMGVSDVPPGQLAAQLQSLSALSALTHLALHGNALPSAPLSRAIASLSRLRTLLLGGA